MKRKHGWKRLVSAVVSAVMLCGTGGILQIPNLFYSDNRLDAYAADTNTVLSIAREYEGNQSYTNLCLKYVQDVFDRAGIYATRLVNATAAKNAWMTHTDRNIPAGAVVFFESADIGPDGHIEIYTGNNTIIGSGNLVSIHEREMTSWYWDRYVGWGWYNGIPLPPDPHIEAPDPVHYKNISEGTFNIINAGSNKYMNYAWGISNPNPMWIDNADGSPEQKFTLKYIGDGKYRFAINHSDGGFVNCECSTPADVHAGTKLTGRTAYDDDTQYFWITPLPNSGSGEFILQSGHDKNLVIGASSGNARSQLTIQRYTGSALQKWKFSPAVKIIPPDPIPPAFTAEKNIKEAVYNLVNCDSGKYMNYAWGISNPNPMWIDNKDGSPEQTFTLKYVDNGKYMLMINHSDGGVVNCECPNPDAVKAGVKLTGRSADYNDTQYFWITPLNDKGEYVLQSGHDEKLVIGASSGNARSQLTIQRYTGSALQKWQLKWVRDLPVPPNPDPVIDSPDFDRGIDVSEFQGTIDWNKVAATGIKFAVIRSATTNFNDATYITDATFAENYKGAKAAGLKVGTYFYTTANTKAEMKSNVSSLLKTLAGKQFDLPVYFDLEQAPRQTALGREGLTEIISYGCSLLRAAGYQPGVYASQNWYQNYIDADKLRSEGVEIWMAAWPFADYPANPSDYDYSEVCSVWQYSSKGTLAGINNNVDVDVRYGKLESVQGDLNADGSLSAADAVLLEKWLLGISDTGISDWKAGDLNGDGRLNVIDMTMLKQLLLKK